MKETTLSKITASVRVAKGKCADERDAESARAS